MEPDMSRCLLDTSILIYFTKGGALLLEAGALAD
jgi:hypothetical protein